MSMQQYWIQIAQQKARTDFQDHPKSFLKGVTNHYSTTVDVYMREAYQNERMDIIAELRELNNG
jgi:hypothetical protein